MRARGAEIAGAVAVGLLVVLLAMAFIPPRTNDATSASVGDSILGTPTPSPEPTESPAASPSPSPEPTPSSEPTPSPSAQEAALIPEGERDGVSIQVVNAGAPTGAAGEMTGRLIAAGFEPRPGGNAVQSVPSTLVIYADDAEAAAQTAIAVAEIEPAGLAEATAQDPNWAAFGDGLDVLVVLGPGLP